MAHSVNNGADTTMHYSYCRAKKSQVETQWQTALQCYFIENANKKVTFRTKNKKKST